MNPRPQGRGSTKPAVADHRYRLPHYSLVDAISVSGQALLIVIWTIPRRIAIFASLDAAVFLAVGTIIFLLPFHFPLSMLELGDWHPVFIWTSGGLDGRQVLIRQCERVQRARIKVASRRKARGELECAHGQRRAALVSSIDRTSIIPSGH